MKNSTTLPISRLLQFIVIFMLLFSLAIPDQVLAAGEMSVTPITWNVVGLDSNLPASGPYIFPVGMRVCNTTGTTITNIQPSFSWGTDSTSNANASNIFLRPGSYGTSGNPFPVIISLAGGACTDVYFEVQILQNGSSYDKARKYVISVAGTLGATAVSASSPTPREIYVEHLISQNRNSVTRLELDSGSGFISIPTGGTMNLVVGETYDIKLVGATATQGYEQIESYINFDNTIFKVNSVSSTYSADAGTDNSSPYEASTKLYADGCRWVNDPNNPAYRSCVSTGKYGGNITITYNVTIVSGAGTSKTLNSLIYDFSGSSYHYNADVSTSARFVSIIGAPDPNAVSITKGFVPSTVTSGGTSQLNITINNPNTTSVSDVAVSDDLPSGMTVNTPLVSSLFGCGVGSLLGTGGSTVNFSGGTIAANSSCVIKVNVSATSSQINTTNNLFVGGVDTTKRGSASITVAATSGPCVNGVTIAKWSVPGTTPPPDNGTGIPSTLYSGVTAVAAGNGISTPSIQTLTISPFASANWWSAKGFNVSSPGSTAASFGFTLTSASKTFSGVNLAFNAGRGKDGATGFTIYASTAPTTALASGTIPTANGNTAQSYSLNLSGTFPSGTTFYIAPYGASNNGANSDFFLDEVTFTGNICSTPSPTVTKSFGSDPILVNGTSVLNFTVANTQTGNVALTGVAFTDTLPVGLTVGSGSVTGTCSASSSGTITTTSPRTISLSGGTLAAGGNCTFAVTITGTAAGNYENISSYISSTQTGTSTSGVNVGYAYDTLSVVTAPTILKSFGATSLYTNEGFTPLTFTITNPNPGATLTGVNFTDTLGSGLVVATPNGLSGSCGGGTITAVAESSSVGLVSATLTAGSSCTFSVNVTGTSAGTKNNNVTVAATGPLAVTGNTSTASILIRDRTPSLEVNKQISLSATGPWSKYVSVILPGNVYYRFTVYNTGDVAISDIAVKNTSDDSLECTITGPVAVGDSATCDSGAKTAVSGSNTNTVYATANSDAVTSKPQTSSARYATTGITLDKTATETFFAAVGDILNYNYQVTNTGAAPLLGPITISDNKTTVTCPEVSTVGDGDDWFDPIVGLTPAESLTCTATFTITSDEISDGLLTNTATATISGINSNTDSVTLNKHQGNLVINKNTIPASDSKVFDFTTTGTGYSNFSLNSSATPSNSTSLNQGTYTVSEDATTGWDLTDIACVVTGTHGSTFTIGTDNIFDAGDSAISVDLKADDTVTCTYTNKRLPILSVVKDLTNDDGGTFTIPDFGFIVDGGTPTAFESDGQNDLILQPGTHNVTESSVTGYLSTYSGCALINLAYGDTDTCTITNNDIAPRLTVIKHVVNDNGGNLDASDFNMTVTGTDVSSASFAGVESPGTTVTLDAGVYSVGETEIAGYTASYSTDCSGSIVIGESKTCTITNDDQPGTLTINKVVVNDDGGSLAADDFSFQVNGGSNTAFESDASNAITVNAGTYNVTESPESGYVPTSNTCFDVVVANGGSESCTITNDDIAPTLTLVKTVTNDDGGSLTAANFPVFIDANAVTWGVANTLNAGTFTAGETAQFGYTAGDWGGDCAADGSITLALGDVKTCTITNDDVAPKLTLIKTVENDNGGSAAETDFTPSVDGAPTTWDTTIELIAGVHIASESSLTGYVAGNWSGDCAADGSVTLLVGDDKTCSITNTDQPATLIVRKIVVNDNGGSQSTDDFTFSVNGGAATAFESDGQNDLTVNTGTYTVTETAVSGYTTSYNNCSGLVIPNGGTETCTITNDDDAPSLTLTNSVTNDDGGTAADIDWTLTATGLTTINGSTPVTSGSTFSAGTYTLSQTGGPATGYSTGAWSCVGGTFTAPDQITIGLGETVSCSIANNDLPPTLNLVKNVTNDDGGDALSNDWLLTATGTSRGFSDAGDSTTFHTVTAGVGYNLSESTIGGYTAGSWSCDGGTLVGDEITLGLDEDVSCQITNDDIAAKLTVIKVVNNNHGGTLTADDFSFQVNSAGAINFESDGQNDLTVNAGTYTVTEPVVTGYATSYDNCSGVALTSGESATCTITNSDIAPTLTLEKTVMNNNAGTLEEGDFPAFIGGAAVSWDIPATIDQAGDYTVSETQQPGYIASDWGGDCAADGSITLAIGDNKTCTITNDDHNPVIHLEKSGTLDITVVTPTGMLDAGDGISYDFAVTNLGNIELSNISITDNTPACDASPVYVSGDTNTNDKLDLTETWHFSCTHTITQPEIESGSYSNTANATGTSPVNGEVTDDDTDDQSFTLVDELIVTKTSTTTSVTVVDQVVLYTITLINGGNTTLSNVTVTDAKCDSAPVYQGGDVNEDHLMQPTEDWIYTCSYTVTQSDIDSGEDISNTVLADATEIDPAEEDTLDIPIVQGPAIELTKTGSLDMTVIDPDTLTNPGDSITYSFSVENTGNVTLWNDITVTDSLLTTLVCIIPLSDAAQFPAGFVPGATAACTASNNVYTLTLDDITAGSVLNTATASTSYETDPVTDDDEVTTETLPVREISLTKTPSVTTFKSVGDTITYTYTITNTGNLELFPTYTVVDDKIALVDCPLTPDPLVPGATVDCTGDYAITQDDLDAGTVVNHATAFANYTPACTGSCVLAQASSDATVNKVIPQPEPTAATADMVTLPATGFAPNQFTGLSGKPESYSDTELTISIPVLGVRTSITGVPNHNGNFEIDWLWQDVGWLQGSAYPGSIGNSVLTAHVYLPNGRPGPFVDLKTLKWGQQIVVAQAGKSYIYEVRSVTRVKPEDVSGVAHKDYGYLTLITCQGYDMQSESYLYRTVVQAVLVDIR